jgi:mannose-1-phosphate guanylyltransferase
MDRKIKNLKSVIMAGGSGTRFWPKSRRLFPKQFLKILSDKSMLQMTIERLLPLTSIDDIYIVGNKNHKALFDQQAPKCHDHHLILEPMGKNTAACIATIAFIIARNNPDSVIFILPADHWITNPGKFRDTLELAAVTAFNDDAIVTLGIPPTFPSTGYGYIQVPVGKKDPGNSDPSVYNVEAFVEKPDLERARAYLASGNFYWNSGIFVTKASVILDEIARFLPDLYRPLKGLKALNPEEIPEFLEATYPGLPAISIDYGVMEKTNRAMMIEANFGWSDVGSWDALYDLSPKDAKENVTEGPVLLENCRGCMVSSHGRLIAGVGLNNIVVIDSSDATLILPRGRSQDVRKIVASLEEKGMEDLL